MNFYLSSQLTSSRQAELLADARRERLVRESRIARRPARRISPLRPARPRRLTALLRSRVPRDSTATYRPAAGSMALTMSAMDPAANPALPAAPLTGRRPAMRPAGGRHRGAGATAIMRSNGILVPPAVRIDHVPTRLA